MVFDERSKGARVDTQRIDHAVNIAVDDLDLSWHTRFVCRTASVVLMRNEGI
jgi:hypothetical protein